MSSPVNARPANHVAPEVSVVVPAFNAAETIEEQLRALRSQRTTFEFEVVVVDNGSTDGTCARVRRVTAQWPDLRLIEATEVRGSAHARNRGVAAARGHIVAFCDADDIVTETWLASLVEVVSERTIAAGMVRATVVNPLAVVASRARTAHDVDLGPDTTPEFAPSGNMAMLRSAYLDLGGMDESFRRSHDVEFSFRARRNGFTISRAADAVIDYRYRQTTRSLATQAFRAGQVSARLHHLYPEFTEPRTVRQGLRSTWWLVSRMPYLALRSRRLLWVGNAARAAGRAVGSVRYRVWYL